MATARQTMRLQGATGEAPSSRFRMFGALLDGPRGRLKAAGAPYLEPWAPDAFVIGSALALNLLGLALPLAVLQVYDRITTYRAVETLALLGVGLVVVAALEFALRLLQHYLLAVDARRRGVRRSVDALDRILCRVGERDAGASAASTLERFHALDTIADYYGGDPRRHMIDLPFSFVFLASMAAIGGWLALAPIVVFAAFAAGLVGALRRGRDLAAEREDTSRRQADFLAEIFGAMPTVKGLGAERPMVRRFERFTRGSADLMRKTVRAASEMQLAGSAFANVNSLATVGVGAIFVISGDLTIGGLAACSLLAGRAIQPLIRAAGAFVELQKAAAAAGTAAPLFASAPPAVVKRRAVAVGGPAVVELRRLFPADADGADASEPALRLPPGGVTLLRGGDGVRRSAFLRLLAGLEAPESGGEVSIDGAPATEARRSLRSVVLVTPTVRLFQGSILENLTLFGAGADVGAAVAAIERIGAAPAIGGLPAGFDTQVTGAGSDTLSVALARSIVLARAIAQAPRLLLLDEPHVFLDPTAEQHLEVALAGLCGETTLVVASDRPSVRRITDAVLDLGSGALTIGRPDAEDAS